MNLTWRKIIGTIKYMENMTMATMLCNCFSKEWEQTYFNNGGLNEKTLIMGRYYHGDIEG